MEDQKATNSGSTQSQHILAELGIPQLKSNPQSVDDLSSIDALSSSPVFASTSVLRFIWYAGKYCGMWNVECHNYVSVKNCDGRSMVAGESVKNNSSKKGVDILLEKMGFKVSDQFGNEVRLSQYMVLEDVHDPPEKVEKGKRELRNLRWEMHDGGAGALKELKGQIGEKRMFKNENSFVEC